MCTYITILVNFVQKMHKIAMCAKYDHINH